MEHEGLSQDSLTFAHSSKACGSILKKAKDAFERLPVQNFVSCNALITGCAQHWLGDEAFTCFRQEIQDAGIGPNVIRIHTVCVFEGLWDYGIVRDWRRNRIMMVEIKDYCRKTLIFWKLHLVDMYSKSVMHGRERAKE